jgi:hypothetical protein
MPHNGRDSVETAIGNIAIISEKSTTGSSPKLESVKIGSDESYYMLAAFCFDLSRKVNYLFKGTRDFAPEADPELAQRLIEDNEAISESGLTWAERARRAEAIMLRSAGELGEQHERVLNEVAGKAVRR